MIVLLYLHQNNFIYRDLKPNNLIVNKNKTVVLIDFDEMVECNSNENHTNDFSHHYIAPEIVEGKEYSFKADIYSLGEVISFIFNEELRTQNNNPIYKKIQEFINQCIKENPDERPDISILVRNFYINFFSNLSANIINENDRFSSKNLLNNDNSNEIYSYLIYLSEYLNPFCQYKLGKLYDEGKLFHCDIKKTIHYYSLAADQNFVVALNDLGKIYLNDPKYQNINKSIKLLTLSANQNCKESQLILGMIYCYGGISISKNIEKSIYTRFTFVTENSTFVTEIFTFVTEIFTFVTEIFTFVTEKTKYH